MPFTNGRKNCSVRGMAFGPSPAIWGWLVIPLSSIFDKTSSCPAPSQSDRICWSMKLMAPATRLRKRWVEGETNVKVLLEEIKAQDYNGEYTILTTFLADYPPLVQEAALPPAQKGTRYFSRQISRFLGQPECDWLERSGTFWVNW